MEGKTFLFTPDKDVFGIGDTMKNLKDNSQPKRRSPSKPLPPKPEKKKPIETVNSHGKIVEDMLKNDREKNTRLRDEMGSLEVKVVKATNSIEKLSKNKVRKTKKGYTTTNILDLLQETVTSVDKNIEKNDKAQEDNKKTTNEIIDNIDRVADDVDKAEQYDTNYDPNSVDYQTLSADLNDRSQVIEDDLVEINPQNNYDEQTVPVNIEANLDEIITRLNGLYEDYSEEMREIEEEVKIVEAAERPLVGAQLPVSTSIKGSSPYGMGGVPFGASGRFKDLLDYFDSLKEVVNDIKNILDDANRLKKYVIKDIGNIGGDLFSPIGGLVENFAMYGYYFYGYILPITVAYASEINNSYINMKTTVDSYLKDSKMYIGILIDYSKEKINDIYTGLGGRKEDEGTMFNLGYLVKKFPYLSFSSFIYWTGLTGITAVIAYYIYSVAKFVYDNINVLVILGLLGGGAYVYYKYLE